jgi:hypothetical protein
LENFRRIGEVGTVEELVNYGYGFFNVISQWWLKNVIKTIYLNKIEKR